MKKHEDAETLRILGRYKREVLLGKAILALGEARRLVGPDSAYHLYFRYLELHRRPPRRSSPSRRR